MNNENIPTQEDNLRAWSALFHETLFAALAPEGFEEITDDRGKRKVAKLDYLTRDRIKRAATLVMNIWKKEKSILTDSLYQWKLGQLNAINESEYIIKKELEVVLGSSEKVAHYKIIIKKAKETIKLIEEFENIIANSTPPSTYDSL